MVGIPKPFELVYYKSIYPSIKEKAYKERLEAVQKALLSLCSNQMATRKDV